MALENKKIKMAFFSRNFPPLVGGMERLNANLVKIFNNYCELWVVGPKGCGAFMSVNITVKEISKKNIFFFMFQGFIQTIYLGLKNKFDVIFGGSGVVAPLCWVASRISGAKFICYVHGLDLISNNLIYRCLFFPFVKRADVLIANSSNTFKLAALKGIDESKIKIIHPGVDYPQRKVDGKDINSFRDKYLLGNKKFLLIAGRLTKRKGVLEFIKYAFPYILEKQPEILLVVAGGEAKDAIGGRGGILSDLKLEGMRNGTSKATKYLGEVNDLELAVAMQTTELLLFPVLELQGDVEGFGMVAVEAAASGTPTVAFSVGGISDAVSDGVSGALIPSGDYNSFAKAVVEYLKGDRKYSALECKEFAGQFSWAFTEIKMMSLVNEATGFKN